VNGCTEEFVWGSGKTRVVWENKDFGENLFHDVYIKQLPHRLA